jgi:hypothetical protein
MPLRRFPPATLPEAWSAGKRAAALLTLALGACVVSAGCQRQQAPTPMTQPTPATQPPVVEPPPAVEPLPVEPLPALRKLDPLQAYDRVPSRPEDPQRRWLRIEGRFDGERPAEAIGAITRTDQPPRIEVTTDNVSHLVLDLNRLPAGVRPGLVLRIDEQGIQITGAAGEQVELVRDSAGLWSVVRRPKPRD